MRLVHSRDPLPRESSIATALTVSTVIPTYNRATFLGRAIRSGLEQMLPGDELIVVDDGSTDSTPAVLDQYSDLIRVVRGPRGGAGAARNRGIEAAQCDLVAFLDSDDEWFAGKMQMQRGLFMGHPGVLYAFGNMACSLADGGVLRRHLWSWHQDPRPWSEILPLSVPCSSVTPLPAGLSDFQVHIGDLFADMAHRLYVLTSSYIARRVEAGNALRFEENVPIYEDWACFARVARLGSGAYLDTELAWQHGQAEERVSDANELERSTVHLSMLASIWKDDAVYQARHSAEFEELVEAQRERRAAGLITTGQLAEARAVLREMRNPPSSHRLLATLPSPIVRCLLAARRGLRHR